MQIAASKELTMPFAQERGLDVPHVFASRAEVDRFPVVVKRSSGAGGVRYVNGPDELEAAEVSGAIIQDWIPGEGFGYFALFDRGRERASFMHRRVREYPVTGGSSTAAESFRDAELARLGKELLSALDWHGVAMVEFKRDVRDGRFKLMEINPKFWGSLDLSIAAGVDFPWLTTQMALGEDYAADPDFRAGLRFQWVFDDVLHAAARPSAAGEVWRDLRDGAVRHDIWPHDLRPSAFDLARTVAVIVGRAARGRLRRPHGQVGPLAQAPSN
jgi:predicted ATP-grasp superfamily ATP-dependent carboligase